jgi:hypothetical protein
MIRSIITEYGLPWVVNRSLYSGKLKMLKAIPSTEKLFEKKVFIKRVDLFAFDTNSIEDFITSLSASQQDEIISIADNALEGRIRAFSSIDFDFGNPINWHYSPVTKAEIPRNLKWYQIPDFDSERGDIKIVWEASRFTHFFYFLRAYMITKNQKYYSAFSEQLDQWIKANDYPYGANFKCGQEATLRMISALIAYSVFKSYGLTKPADTKNVISLVGVSYKKVLSNFFYAHKCIKNNHTLSEITGLIIGAWCCKDQVRLRRAYRLLDNEIASQFLHDGGYIQYSFNYQRFALQLMELVQKISERTGMTISNRSRDLIGRSALLMYQMQDDTGDMPNYGSNDGALIFPVTSCGYRDFRPVVNTVISLLTGKRLFDPGVYDEELLWFGNRPLEMVPVVKVKKESSAFDNSGFYSIRHNSGFMMIVLQDFKTRPAQMDQLHIDLWHKGINILCDSGTYSYATELGKSLSMTQAHNTAVVHGKEQMEKHGPFLMYDWTSAKNVRHELQRFSGTMISKNGYAHTRSVEKTKSGYLVSDEVKGNGDCCSFKFHSPCEVRINDNGFDLYHKAKLICSVRTAGEIKVDKSYGSLYYLQKDEVNSISVNYNLITGEFQTRPLLSFHLYHPT